MPCPASPLQLANAPRPVPGPGAPRTAGALIGGFDRSFWHVGEATLADVKFARRLGHIGTQHRANAHVRALSFVAAVLRGRRLHSLGEARALVQAAVVQELQRTPRPGLAAVLARATECAWRAMQSVGAAVPPHAA